MAKMKLEIDVEPAKVDALKVFLGKKNTSIEIEIIKYIDVLYGKNVPNIVREYLSDSLDSKKNEGRSEA